MADEETGLTTVADGVDPEDDNLALVALTPSDMPEQQRKLSAWCARKIDHVERELGHWTALQDEAIVGGFKHASYTAGLNRTAKRIDYYKKIKAAVDAGYLIVPNMPTVTFAVRVKRAKPAQRESSSHWQAGQATPELLPAGEGRYVDEVNHVSSRKYPDENYKGEPTTKTMYFSTDYDEEVDFPLKGVMPEVLRATSQAMALRLFDQLGVVQNSGGRDPIVVGQVLDPRGNQRLTTFFVAWWLNTGSL
jgi:hypothetical protein